MITVRRCANAAAETAHENSGKPAAHQSRKNLSSQIAAVFVSVLFVSAAQAQFFELDAYLYPTPDSANDPADLTDHWTLDVIVNVPFDDDWTGSAALAEIVTADPAEVFFQHVEGGNSPIPTLWQQFGHEDLQFDTMWAKTAFHPSAPIFFAFPNDPTGLGKIITGSVGQDGVSWVDFEDGGGGSFWIARYTFRDTSGLGLTLDAVGDLYATFYFQAFSENQGTVGVDLPVDVYRQGFRPQNDDCNSAVAVTEGSFAFDTRGATTDGPDELDCADGLDPTGSDVWFCYTATCNGTVVVGLCNSDFDTTLAVYPGCTCGFGTPIVCSDDNCGLQSAVEFSATAGTDYLICVGGYDGAQGQGVLEIQCGLPACCLPDGTCGVMTVEDCDSVDGVYEWREASCTPEACPSGCPSEDTIYNQPGWKLLFGEITLSDEAFGARYLDNFSGLSDPICQIHWWGSGFDVANFSFCDKDSERFNIRLYEDDNGAPGALVCEYLDVVPTTKIDAGFNLPSNAALYGVRLESCCTLSQGWVSIEGVDSADACYFAWYNALPGDELAYYTDGMSFQLWPHDLGFCLSTQIAGACCFGDGDCQPTSPGDCAAAGGAYVGNGTTCMPDPCPQPGACCLADGGCELLLLSDCTMFGGVFKGEGLDCDPDLCLGACCLPDGACLETSDPECNSGIWQGPDTNCDPNACPQPGACCFYDGTCLTVLEVDCNGLGGHFRGEGVACVAGTCVGACCLYEGTCIPDTILADCNEVGSTWHSFGSTCDPSPCLALGACCMPGDQCTEGVDHEVCLLLLGYFQGPGTFCLAGGCGPCFTCGGDLDGSGRVDGGDIQMFVDCMTYGGENCSCADMDGFIGLNSGDVQAFVDSLLAGVNCP